ncbi:MAG: CheR family methyltransferase, partial [Mangrovicoccus sp.]
KTSNSKVIAYGRPIDVFFESLAADAGEHAVGIILSGTGSDGSEGIKALKAAGGLVFVQDPSQARYDGMPRRAIETGATDLILQTHQMMDALSDYFDRKSGLVPEIQSDRDFLDKVFKHVRYHTGHDFTDYKQSTLLRRLTLRMSVLGVTSPNDYIKRLIQDRDEAQKLISDVLINVTGFFRDAEVWEVMRHRIIPELVALREAQEEIRVWVPGCSSGQEAYTIAMLFAQELERTNLPLNVSVFGTDIDDDALQQARRGLYPQSIIEEVPEQLLQTYFNSTPEGFEVGKVLRNMVRFSQQSLIKDPPFGKLDMVSCRNLMIYFEAPLQKTSMSIFHYALRPGGILLLGQSENPNGLNERFLDINGGCRIFARDTSPARPLELPVGRFSSSITRLSDDRNFTTNLPVIHRGELERLMLQRYAPPYVLIDAAHGLKYAAPGVERYLRIPVGDQSYDLTSLVIPVLESPLRRLFAQQAEHGDQGSSVDVLTEYNGEKLALRLEASWVASNEAFVVFRDMSAQANLPDFQPVATPSEDQAYVTNLERELADARQTIRTTVEELETSNEELKSSNEEMMSMNEELQSSNEELSTINDELQNNIAELNTLNADLSSFVASTSLATVFLDEELRLRRFTPRATEFFRFVESDIGRAFQDIASDIPLRPLLRACRDVLDSREVEEIELAREDGGASLIVRIAPNQTDAGQMHGLVFTLIDVTELRQYAAAAEASREEAQQRLAEIEGLYLASPIGMAQCDTERRFIRLNQQMADLVGLSMQGHLDKRLEDLFPEAGPVLRDNMDKVLETGKPQLNMEVVAALPSFPDKARRWIFDFYPLRDGAGAPAVGMNVRDITEQKQVEDELRQIMLELQHRVKNMLANVKALVNRAKRDPRDDKEVMQTLSDRIDSMARTHALLASESWHSSGILDLIKPELTDVYGDELIDVQGPDIHVNARAGLAIALSMHELATNSAKYGALSSNGGMLSLRWLRVDEGSGDFLRFVWTENCQTEITPPTETGFGTKL